jgi:hypothetical protein
MFLGYVKRTERGSIDSRMAELAARAVAQGLNVSGVVQTNIPRAETHRCDMDVQVLPDGEIIRISQDLGPAARGCWLDPSALEYAVELVTQSLSTATDLLIVNKFGKHEASGRGFPPRDRRSASHGYSCDRRAQRHQSRCL